MAYSWLPDTLDQEYFDTDEDWINAAYQIFEQDFIEIRQHFMGLPIGAKPLPQYPGLFAGKNGTFRHLATKGEIEEYRELAPERVTRMRWIKCIIQRAGTNDILVWKTKRRGEDRWVLSLTDFSYIVILTPRKNQKTGKMYFLLWAGYPVLFKNRQEKLRKEYERYIRAQK